MRHLSSMLRRTVFTYSNQTQNIYPQHKTLVINHNLKFDAKDYDLFLIPSHPRIVARGMNAVEVDSRVPVVELALVRKPSAEEAFSKHWKQRVQFEFTFNQLHTLLDLQPTSGSTASFQFEREGKSISYELVDVVEEGEVRLEYRQGKGKEGSSTAASASLSYGEFELLQEVIKESLYDLSGLRFQLESRRQEEVTITLKQLNTLKEKQDETKSFYSQ